MTQLIDEPVPPAGRSPRRAATPATRRRWWRRPWIVPLALVVVAFLTFSLPPYLSFDPANSRVPAPPDFAPHFPLLVGHVLFGSVAMLTCLHQIWPWLRRRNRAAHRIVGRVYVFGGVLPAGLLGLTVGAFSPYGPTARISDVLLALLWLAVTGAGFRMAVKGRYAEHRRWMIRSFALTMSIITNRLWAVVMAIVLAPQLETTYGGDQARFAAAIASVTTWAGWVLSLLIAEWWLDRDATRRDCGRSTRSTRSAAVAAGGGPADPGRGRR
ncbi:DUF2306 domain-containing protein [Micromonospora zhanjiangensis]|uniref:DUF2306 domain-containing protein n=1 Tax=Micromonospora zhanjiangensis TaxID=1522057 RepID=A0ABV8KIH0_9ACTN